MGNISFVVYLDLVSFSFREFGVDVFGILERINGLLVETSSGDTTLHRLKDIVSDGSLVPYDSTEVGDGEIVIWHRIVSCHDYAEVKRFDDLYHVSDSGGVSGSTRISTYGNESDGSEDRENRDDDDELDEGEALEFL